MADDRPIEDPTAQLARVTRELEDLKSTVLARLSTRPTGDIEPTVRTAAKAGTLLMQGQTASRVTYVALWQWVQDQGLVGVFFTNGDGSTTFGLPDFRGRVPVGAGALAVGALVGADNVTLTTAQTPSHNHGVAASHSSVHTHGFSTDYGGNHNHAFTTDPDGAHNHGFTTDMDGTHDGHFPAQATLVAGGATYGVAAWNTLSTWVANHNHAGFTGSQPTHNHAGFTGSQPTHNHAGTTGTDGVYSHTIAENNVGSGSSFDNRQSSIAVNWMIYT